MPKQALVVNDFSGGLNTYQNERDLNVNELTVCQTMTSQKGKTLLSRGSFIAHSEVPTQGATISGGFGLVSFESDYSPVPYEAVDTSQSTNLIFVGDNDVSDAVSGSGTFLGSNNKGNPFGIIKKDGKKIEVSDIIISSFKK